MLTRASSVLRTAGIRHVASAHRALTSVPTLTAALTAAPVMRGFTSAATAVRPHAAAAPSAPAQEKVAAPKMSIKFSLADSPGALQDALGYFARHGVNMTRLESRPSKRSTDYGQLHREYSTYVG